MKWESYSDGLEFYERICDDLLSALLAKGTREDGHLLPCEGGMIEQECTCGLDKLVKEAVNREEDD